MKNNSNYFIVIETLENGDLINQYLRIYLDEKVTIKNGDQAQIRISK